jgi:proline iminopeptidase
VCKRAVASLRSTNPLMSITIAVLWVLALGSVPHRELAGQILPPHVTEEPDTGASVVDRTIKLRDGTAIRVSESGRGPLLLLLHGGPSLGRRYLLETVRALADRHRVVVYDQRGAGESGSGADSVFGYSRLVEDVGEVATALGAQRFSLMGHSWGALLALSDAVRHPGRVDRLIVVSPSEPGSRFSRESARRLAERTLSGDSAAMRAAFGSKEFAEGVSDGVDEVFRAMYRPWFGVRDSTVRLQSGLTRAQVDRARAMGTRVSRQAAGIARWTDLPGLRLPVLIVHGSQDRFPPEISVEMSRVIRGASLRLLADVGHFPMLEVPDRFHDEVSRFLSATGEVRP